MITYPTSESLELHAVVSNEQWLIARKELLKKEKELTRLRDEISARRRELPWVRVKKNHVFEGPNGRETLADLFEGAASCSFSISCLVPAGKRGCDGCSFLGGPP